MSTEFFNDQWRIPSNENQNKVSNYSMDFGGTNQSINLGSDFPYPSTVTDPWSVSFWIKPNSATSSGSIFSTYDVSGIRGFYVNLRSGGVNNDPLHVSSLMRAGTTGYSSVATSDPIAVGEWQHIVVAFDGVFNATLRGITIYVNGSPVSIYRIGSVATNGSLITSVNKYIGQIEDNSNYLTNCELDQVTFFDYELSQDQVTQLGAEGYAFKFANDIILFANGSTMARQQNISYSVWVKSTSLSATRYIVGNNTSSNKGTSIFLLNDVLVFQIGNNGNNSYFNSRVSSLSNYVNANEWFHVAASWDGTDSKIYINGVERNSWTPSQPYTISGWNNNFIIGRRADSTSSGFYGELSNVAFWDSGLTPTQVQTIYNNGTPNDISLLNPVGWWKLNQQDVFVSPNWTITDYGSGGNDGTSGGMNSANLVASNINGELVANPMITSPKPIAYYQLGDQSVDNGANYLVPNNSLSDYVFNIDSSNVNYIDLGTNPFSFTQNLTVSFWMKSTQTASNTFIGKDINVSGGRNWMVMLYQTRVYFWTTSTGSIGNLKSIQSNVAGGVSDGKWHHIVCVNNQTNATKQIYIDGVLDVTNNNGGLISTSSSPVQIGKRPSGFPYDGEMSNVALWDTALTGPQVATIYNNGAPNDISSLSPVAWYKLDAGEIFNSTSINWSVDNNAYPSVYQSSLDFNGTSDYIDTPQIDLGSTNTISFWINTTTTTQGTIFGDPNGYADYALFSQPTLNRTAFRLGNNDSGYYQIEVSSGLLNDGNWHHHCLTRDGVTINYYIDGILQTNVINNTLNASAGTNTTIENIFAMPNGNFKYGGKLSNVALFNSALISSQVQTLYNNGTPEASISYSPVSWWKLDNTTTGIQDSAGSNNGTNNGATEYAGFVNELAGKSFNMNSANLVTSDLQQTSGYSPYALNFDGVNDYLDANRTVASNLNFSVSAWINPTSYATVMLGTRNLSSASTSNGFTMNINSSGNLWGRIFTETSNITQVQTGSTISLNNWSHVAMTYDSSSKTLKTYLNGSEVGSIIGTDSSVTSTAELNIGRASIGTFYDYFDGSISNVSIFNTELTSTEVTEIYNEGVPSNLNNFSGTAPVAWWQLGSNSSFNTNWTCLDEIGTNNAVSVNMTNVDIVDGVGYSASGIGTSSIDIKGDAPYSTANGLSENMDVLDRTTDVPS